MKSRTLGLRGNLVCIAAFGLGAAGCAPIATPTYFVAPTQAPAVAVPQAGAATVGPEAGTTPMPVAVPSVAVATSTPPCTNALSYIQDLTIPDGSNVAPGQSLDKEWQVKNSGTCNWDERYRFKLISGNAMGVSPLLPLYPARAGTDAVLHIRLVAPQSAGLFECHWQAIDPDGQPFGDPVYMQISVTP